MGKNLYNIMHSLRSIIFSGLMAWQWMTKEETSHMSQLVWWMIEVSPVFCGLPSRDLLLQDVGTVDRASDWFIVMCVWQSCVQSNL